MKNERQIGMEISPGDKIHGFTVISVEEIAEIEGKALVLRHDKSKARLLSLQNDDNNKAFSIAFKTPPANDTGVFHILEHSVLCGSRKFPVKEPFVDLLKSSMQTFLNAMTFDDKTMYPVASTNEQDLINLIDVYLDAVLHPAIYQKAEIFKQEGWHYELKDNIEADRGDSVGGGAVAMTESADHTAKLTLNGVVYNEMKGALSNPNSVLYDQLQAALFPDNAYRFESGGAPHSIPHLSYDQFLEEHQRHYRLDNSYLTLYGNLNLKRVLSFLDKAYLSPVAVEQQKQASENNLTPRHLELQKPIVNTNVVKTMATAPENACAALGYVVGRAHERRRIIGVDIMLDALLGSNEAPLKRILLDAELADDVLAFMADAMLQPFAVIQLRGAKIDAAKRLHSVFQEAMSNLYEQGIDHELLEASLSRAEFNLRERDFGIADGVALSMEVLSVWLYDDSRATDYLHYEKDFAFLREQLGKGYFERLLKEVFLENDHWAQAEVRPVDNENETTEAEYLQRIAADMKPADFMRISDEEAALRRMQIAADSKQALATLPRLALADIAQAPEEPTPSLARNTALPCLRHHLATHGVCYVYRYFDMNRVSFEELPYVSILAMVLGKLGTAHHSASQIDTLVNGRLGNLSFFPEIYEGMNGPLDLTPKFVVGSSSLAENVENLATLPLEIIMESDFSDVNKIKDVLQQRRISMEQGFASAGHAAAMARASSYYLPAAVAREQLEGIDFYRFLKDLLANFDHRAGQLAARLEDLALRLFVDDRSMLSFAGTKKDEEKFWQAGAITGRKETSGKTLELPLPRLRNEAFIVSSDVCYTALGYDRRAFDAPYTGVWQVASRALSFDYLWNEVRVKGGAYGAGFNSNRAGNMRFFSYRDPHIDQTFARFDQAADWLASFNPEPKSMEGYVVSSVAGFDAPLKPRIHARQLDANYFCGINSEMHLQTRSEIRETTLAQLHALAETIKRAAAKNALCVFGNKDIIKDSSLELNEIDLLNE